MDSGVDMKTEQAVKRQPLAKPDKLLAPKGLAVHLQRTRPNPA